MLATTNSGSRTGRPISQSKVFRQVGFKQTSEHEFSLTVAKREPLRRLSNRACRGESDPRNLYRLHRQENGAQKTFESAAGREPHGTLPSSGIRQAAEWFARTWRPVASARKLRKSALFQSDRERPERITFCSLGERSWHPG